MSDATKPRRRSSRSALLALSGGGLIVATLLAQTFPEWIERRRMEQCDALFTALASEVENELDTVIGCMNSCGDVDLYGAQAAISCVLEGYLEVKNPRNEHQSAYTGAVEVTSNASSCRVSLVPASPFGVRFSQYPTPHATTSRTFSVSLD